MPRYRYGRRSKGGAAAAWVTFMVLGVLMFIAGIILVALGARGIGRPTEINTTTTREAQVATFNSQVTSFNADRAEWVDSAFSSNSRLLQVFNQTSGALLHEGPLVLREDETTEWRTKGMHSWTPASFVATFALSLDYFSPTLISFTYDGLVLATVNSTFFYQSTAGQVTDTTCTQSFAGSLGSGVCQVMLRMRDVCVQAGSSDLASGITACWSPFSTATEVVGNSQPDCQECIETPSAPQCPAYRADDSCNQFTASSYFAQYRSSSDASVGYLPRGNVVDQTTVTFRLRSEYDPYTLAYRLSSATMRGLPYDDDDEDDDGPYWLLIYIGIPLLVAGAALCLLSSCGACLTTAYKRQKKQSGNAQLTFAQCIGGCCGVLHQHWTSSPTVVQVPSNSDGVGYSSSPAPAYATKPPISTPGSADFPNGMPDDSSSGSEA